MVASDLPREGTSEEALGRPRVWVVWHRLTEFCTSVERLAWAKASGCPWYAWTCAGVALVGRLEVLQWARDQNCPCDAHSVKRPLRAGTWRC